MAERQRGRTINPPGPANQQEARSQSVTLPYVRVVSEAVRRILTPLGVRVSFRPNVTLRHLLVRPKDRIPENETTGVVYQVPCASCPATYVGQTGRRLDQRLREKLYWHFGCKLYKDKSLIEKSVQFQIHQMLHTFCGY